MLDPWTRQNPEGLVWLDMRLKDPVESRTERNFESVGYLQSLHRCQSVEWQELSGLENVPEIQEYKYYKH